MFGFTIVKKSYLEHIQERLSFYKNEVNKERARANNLLKTNEKYRKHYGNLGPREAEKIRNAQSKAKKAFD